MICGACGYKVLTEVEIFPRLRGANARTVYALSDKGIAIHDEVCTGDGIFHYEPEEIAQATRDLVQVALCR